MDEIESALRDQPVELALNIHSFPECRQEAIAWWADLLARYHVRHLMVAGNLDDDRLVTADGHDSLPVLEKSGYRIIAKEPKYRDPAVQEYGALPCWHHLLELQS